LNTKNLVRPLRRGRQIVSWASSRTYDAKSKLRLVNWCAFIEEQSCQISSRSDL